MEGSDAFGADSSHTVGDKVELIAEDTPKRESAPLKAAKKLLEAKSSSTDHSHSFRVIVISGIVFAISITIALILSIYLGPPLVGANGAVATDVAQCSDMGLSILQKGGNAVDAAIASCLCLGVINSQSSGLGGGGFMIVHDHKIQKSWGYDFRETAPALATVNMFKGVKDIYNSSLAVAVPGELRGLEAAHNAHGKLKWHRVIRPVAEMARNGFNVTKDLAKALRTKVDVSTFGAKMREVFAPNGVLVSAGDFMQRPDLADTLDIIAEEGADALYTGYIADSIIKAVKPDGILSKGDLAQYKVVMRDIIHTKFKGGYVGSLPPPSSGAILLLMLNIMEGFNWTSADLGKPETYFNMSEAMKFAYAHHGEFGDSYDDNLLEIISKTYAKSLREKITNETHNPQYYGATSEPVQNGGTTHLSVVDAEELAVTLTSTVNTWFGSKIMTSTGIILNNCMTDFSIPTSKSLFDLPPNPHNLIAPGKRPLSSMVPTIVFNKEEPCAKRMVLGASNGTKIISGVAQVITNVMLFNLNLTYAIDKPRIHNQLFPDQAEYENGVPEAVTNYLKGRGQKVQPVTEGINVVQAVMKKNDQIYAHSDIRKHGKAALYTPVTK